MRSENAEKALQKMKSKKTWFLYNTFIVMVHGFSVDEFDEFTIELKYKTADVVRPKKFRLEKINKDFFSQLMPYDSSYEKPIIADKSSQNVPTKEQRVEIVNPPTIHEIKILNPPKHKSMNSKSNNQNEETAVPTTLNDLRDILLHNIRDLREGKIPLDQAKEIANQTQTVINLTKLELQYRSQKAVSSGGPTQPKLSFMENKQEKEEE